MEQMLTTVEMRSVCTQKVSCGLGRGFGVGVESSLVALTEALEKLTSPPLGHANGFEDESDLSLPLSTKKLVSSSVVCYLWKKNIVFLCSSMSITAGDILIMLKHLGSMGTWGG